MALWLRSTSSSRYPSPPTSSPTSTQLSNSHINKHLVPQGSTTTTTTTTTITPRHSGTNALIIRIHRTTIDTRPSNTTRTRTSSSLTIVILIQYPIPALPKPLAFIQLHGFNPIPNPSAPISCNTCFFGNPGNVDDSNDALDRRKADGASAVDDGLAVELTRCYHCSQSLLTLSSDSPCYPLSRSSDGDATIHHIPNTSTSNSSTTTTNNTTIFNPPSPSRITETAHDHTRCATSVQREPFALSTPLLNARECGGRVYDRDEGFDRFVPEPRSGVESLEWDSEEEEECNSKETRTRRRIRPTSSTFSISAVFPSLRVILYPTRSQRSTLACTFSSTSTTITSAAYHTIDIFTSISTSRVSETARFHPTSRIQLILGSLRNAGGVDDINNEAFDWFAASTAQDEDLG
ncbi:hypothetical protein ONZ45_g18239 [Pleurotus djamor]|nr:hypothetical protein ONZ45_g18239 [Pleurotus djamor]